MKYNLVWETEVPNLSESENLHLSREIVYIEQSVESVEDLIFHSIMFSNDLSDHSVLAYGKEGNSKDLFLKYSERDDPALIDSINCIEDMLEHIDTFEDL